MSVRPPLLVVSAVLPFPAIAGQRQRVRLKLEALREHFELGFLTLAAPGELEIQRRRLLEHVDRAFVLPSRYAASRLWRWGLRAAYPPWAAVTRLRFSNLVVPLELGAARVERALGGWRPECALFEYWHTWRTARALGRTGIATILDMHDLLSHTFDRDLQRRRIPAPLRHWLVAGYRAREERAWQSYDHLLAINRAEQAHAAETLADPSRVSLVPMGVDLTRWPFVWEPTDPPRFAFYGGLGSTHNQLEAVRCLDQLMPRIWQRCPDAELWLIGSNPPSHLVARGEADRRVHVTGFVEDPVEVLRSCRAVLCPWVGTYGFRSRLIEVMAVGVPVVATRDAVDGMALEQEHGIAFGATDDELAQRALELLAPDVAISASQRGRRRIEELYSFEATYGQLAGIAQSLIERRRMAA